MDALSDVLRVARLSGGVFMRAEFTAPWCVAAQLTPEKCAPFLKQSTQIIPYHYVVEGELYGAAQGGPPVLLRGGDLVLFPANEPHLMGSDLSLPPVRVAEIVLPSDGSGLRAVQYGKGGARTTIICGFLGYEAAQGNPIFSAMPPIIRLQIDDIAPAEWIRTNFQYAANEIASGRPGSDTLLAKLSELLFVEAVRRYAENLPPGQTGWFAGLQDSTVSRALTLLHGDLARAWNVEELAHEIGVSRSVLAEKFVRLIGTAPIQYLTQWRMQVAAQKLRESNASLIRIAESVGYNSEAAFSRAFKKAFGRAPAGWRRDLSPKD